MRHESKKQGFEQGDIVRLTVGQFAGRVTRVTSPLRRIECSSGRVLMGHTLALQGKASGHSVCCTPECLEHIDCYDRVCWRDCAWAPPDVA